MIKEIIGILMMLLGISTIFGFLIGFGGGPWWAPFAIIFGIGFVVLWFMVASFLIEDD